MVVAVLGGTFDPPHLGHLLLAECAAWQFGCERVLFMPAGEPYRKAWRDVTPAAQRLEMVTLAVRDNVRFEADDREVRRSGPTYTVDTLLGLQAEGVERPLLILGLDAVADMPNWKDPARIGELARIAVALKGGQEADMEALARAAGLPETPAVVDMPALAVSGTMIRARVAAGKPVRYLVPPAVADYIEARGLYRSGEGAEP